MTNSAQVYTPYSRHGHDEQTARRGRHICASVRKSWRNIIVTSRSCAVTSLFRHLLYATLFKKTRLGSQALTAWIGCITRAELLHDWATSFCRLTWGVHFVSWTLAICCTTCNLSVTNVACKCRNNSYTGSIYIAYYCAKTWYNIKPTQPHFNTQPLARWRHSRITKWRVSMWPSCSYNSCNQS